MDVVVRTLDVWRDRVHPRVQIAGDGPPLVYLHGPYGLQWNHFLDDLARDFTVYAPEHPGTSPGDPDGIQPIDDLWDLTLYYYEVLDRLGLDAPAMVGHSFGGMVAAEIAATNPDRVSRLVMLAPLGLWLDDAPVKNWMLLPADELVRATLVDPRGPLAQELWGLPDDPGERVEAQIQRTWSLACTGKFVWPLPDKGLKKRLHRISAPTLLVWGEQDGLVPSRYADAFAAAISGARVERIDRASHFPHLERRETVTPLVRHFAQS